MTSRATAIGLVLSALAACGPHVRPGEIAMPGITVNPSSIPQDTGSPPPTYRGPHTLTEADSGATVHLAIGDRIRIELPAGYDPPPRLDGVVVTMAAAGGYPSASALDVTLRAARDGTMRVTTQTDAPCFHATPACTMPQHMWTAVLVVGS